MESISYVFSRIALALFLVLQHLGFQYSEAQSWVRVGFWSRGIPISDINSSLFTHLVCSYADVNSSSYEISTSSRNNTDCSVFTAIVKRQKPSIITLLSIAIEDDTVYSSMVSNESSRRSFIESSIRIARRYGFQGLDLFDLLSVTTKTLSPADNTGRLFQEWRAAAKSEASDSSKAELILTACVYYSPPLIPTPSLVESIESNLNWIHVMTFGYSTPGFANFTAASSALYDPSSNASTAYGVHQWIGRGVSSTKLVLGLPFFGFAWSLKNPGNNSIGAPATGPGSKLLVTWIHLDRF